MILSTFHKFFSVNLQIRVMTFFVFFHLHQRVRIEKDTESFEFLKSTSNVLIIRKVILFG